MCWNKKLWSQSTVVWPLQFKKWDSASLLILDKALQVFYTDMQTPLEAFRVWYLAWGNLCSPYWGNKTVSLSLFPTRGWIQLIRADNNTSALHRKLESSAVLFWLARLYCKCVVIAMAAKSTQRYCRWEQSTSETHPKTSLNRLTLIHTRVQTHTARWVAARCAPFTAAQIKSEAEERRGR